MGLSKSKPLYIAILGTPNSGLKELINIYKQKEAADKDKLKIDQKSAKMGIWFKHKKSTLCVHHNANDDPSTWLDQLENHLNNNQLDAIFLVLPTDKEKFNDTAEFHIKFDQNEFNFIMSHWSRQETYIDMLPPPILDLIYRNLAKIYKTKQVYQDFLKNNYQFYHSPYIKETHLIHDCPLGVYANGPDHHSIDNLALNEMVEETNLHQLRSHQWYIQKCDSYNTANNELSQIDGVWELLEWTANCLNNRKNLKNGLNLNG